MVRARRPFVVVRCAPQLLDDTRVLQERVHDLVQEKMSLLAERSRLQAQREQQRQAFINGLASSLLQTGSPFQLSSGTSPLLMSPASSSSPAPIGGRSSPAAAGSGVALASPAGGLLSGTTSIFGSSLSGLFSAATLPALAGSSGSLAAGNPLAATGGAAASSFASWPMSDLRAASSRRLGDSSASTSSPGRSRLAGGSMSSDGTDDSLAASPGAVVAATAATSVVDDDDDDDDDEDQKDGAHAHRDADHADDATADDAIEVEDDGAGAAGDVGSSGRRRTPHPQRSLGTTETRMAVIGAGSGATVDAPPTPEMIAPVAAIAGRHGFLAGGARVIRPNGLEAASHSVGSGPSAAVLAGPARADAFAPSSLSRSLEQLWSLGLGPSASLLTAINSVADSDVASLADGPIQGPSPIRPPDRRESADPWSADAASGDGAQID